MSAPGMPEALKDRIHLFEQNEGRVDRELAQQRPKGKQRREWVTILLDRSDLLGRAVTELFQPALNVDALIASHATKRETATANPTSSSAACGVSS